VSRKQAASLRRHRSGRLVGWRIIAHSVSVALLCLIVIGCVGYFRHSGYFQLRTIHIRGHLEQVDRASLEAAVTHSITGDFFTVQLGQMQQALVELPWVKRVVIRREWPNVLSLSVEENKAVARWGKDAFLVDSGQVLRGSLVALVGLPMLSGPDGSASDVYHMYHVISSQLSPLHLQVSQLMLDVHGEWRVVTQNGMVLSLGGVHVRERLERFVALYPRLVNDRKQMMAKVDLRYRNGVAVQWGGDE